MFCDEALDAIEPIAAGDLTPEGRIAEHVATCPNCAAALARARHVEQMLRQRPAPKAPAQFTAHTLGRVRRARWRSDQVLDVGFNLAIGLIVVGVIVAVWLLAHRSGLASVSNDAAGLFTTGLMTAAQHVAPAVPLYAGATALVLTALGIWWWAERDAA
jgi:anti-sigma factor RsiW